MAYLKSGDSVETSGTGPARTYETERLLSLWPELRDLEQRRYEQIMVVKSALPRTIKEMIAATVSAANRCDYCVEHHVALMVEAGIEPDKAWQVADDYRRAGLDEKSRALLDFVLNPRLILTEQKDVDHLRELGLSDRQILEAVIVAGFFRDFNLRVSLLGLELEDWFEPVPKS